MTLYDFPLNNLRKKKKKKMSLFCCFIHYCQRFLEPFGCVKNITISYIVNFAHHGYRQKMVTSLQVDNKNHQIPWKIDIYAYYSIDN